MREEVLWKWQHGQKQGEKGRKEEWGIVKEKKEEVKKEQKKKEANGKEEYIITDRAEGNSIIIICINEEGEKFLMEEKPNMCV